MGPGSAAVLRASEAHSKYAGRNRVDANGFPSKHADLAIVQAMDAGPIAGNRKHGRIVCN